VLVPTEPRPGVSAAPWLPSPITLPDLPVTAPPPPLTAGRVSFSGDIDLPSLPDMPSVPAAAGRTSVLPCVGTVLPPPRVCLAVATLFSEFSNLWAKGCTLAPRPEAPLHDKVP